jgi:PII-like signaling protein
VNEDCLKLTTYFGERDRLGSRFLADAFVDIYARHRLQTSLVMRGVEGFGAKQHLHTDRLLTLSEDLPLVAVAVDSRARIETALHDTRSRTSASTGSSHSSAPACSPAHCKPSSSRKPPIRPPN